MDCVLSHFSRVWLFATLWTVAHQASLSLGFSRQEYWSGLPCIPPGYLPDPGIEPGSPVSCIVGGFFTTEPPGKPSDGMKVKVKSLSRVRLFATPWTVAYSSIHGILQARILEWVAISFSKGSSRPRDRTWVSSIAGRRFNLWATCESLYCTLVTYIILQL